MKFFLLFLVSSFIVPTISTISPCHESEHVDPTGHFCYVLNNQFLTFHEAEKACFAYGGYTLAKVPNMIDNNFIWSMIRSTGNHYWIGLTDTTLDGNFHWLDGSPLEFTNWANNIVSNSGDCAVIDSSSGKWRPMPCNFQSNLICYSGLQKNETTSAPPTRKETEKIMFMIDAESMGDPNVNETARNFYTKERDFLVSLMETLVADPNTPTSNCTYVAGYAFYGYSQFEQEFDHSYPSNPNQWIYGVKSTNWLGSTQRDHGIEDAINLSKKFYWAPEIKDFSYSTLIFLTARQNTTGLPSLDTPKSTFDDTIVLSLNNSPFQTTFTNIKISNSFTDTDIYNVLPYLQCH